MQRVMNDKDKVERDTRALAAAWEEVKHVKLAAGLCVAEVEARTPHHDRPQSRLRAPSPMTFRTGNR